MTKWKASPFTRLKGTIKAAFDEKVGPCTLWVGNNQSGKTARLTAVRYALAGVHGYSAGGSHGSEIAALAPEGCEHLFAELTGPSGQARFDVYRREGKWREPDPRQAAYLGDLEKLDEEARARVLPLVSMNELLHLGPDLGRRALVQRFGEATALPRPVALNEVQAALWDEMAKKVTQELTKDGVTPDYSEVLVGMNKAFNKRKLAEGKEIRALEKVLNERRDDLAEKAAGAEQIPQMKQDLIVAQAWAQAAQHREVLARLETEDKPAYRASKKAYETRVTSEIDREKRVREEAWHSQAIADTQAEIDALQADLDAQNKKLATGEWLLATLTHLSTTAENAGDAHAPCPLCKNTFAPAAVQELVRPVVETRQASIAEVAERMAAAVQKRAEVQEAKVVWLAQLAKSDKALDEERQRLQQEATRILTEERAATDAIAQIGAPAEYSGKTAAEIEAEIAELEEAIRARAQLESDTADLRVRKAARDMAKEMEGESKQLLDKLIRQTKTTAEAAVNRYMPAGMTAQLDLDKGRWAVLDSTGVARTRHTMCGYETNALVPALAAAYTEGAPLRVLTLDDPDIDGVGSENVEAFFAALKAAVDEGYLTQVFVGGNRLEHKLRALHAAGWTIISTDGRDLAQLAGSITLDAVVGEFQAEEARDHGLIEPAPRPEPAPGPEPEPAVAVVPDFGVPASMTVAAPVVDAVVADPAPVLSLFSDDGIPQL